MVGKWIFVCALFLRWHKRLSSHNLTSAMSPTLLSLNPLQILSPNMLFCPLILDFHLSLGVECAIPLGKSCSSFETGEGVSFFSEPHLPPSSLRPHSGDFPVLCIALLWDFKLYLAIVSKCLATPPDYHYLQTGTKSSLNPEGLESAVCWSQQLLPALERRLCLASPNSAFSYTTLGD